MVVIGNSESMIVDDAAHPIDFDAAREFVADLVKTIGNEPALAFWDASNEPDYNAPPAPRDRERKRLELARFIATTFHQLDPKTPVTIGVAFERNMEALADAVDVLSFHDYLQTRAAIRGDIARAKTFAAGVGKPVINTEIGCVARANPYDVTLEEHMQAGVGWYIWELMITKRWGNVHGVFYPDGTVRDPSIPAAMFGMFRNRSENLVLENPDRENWVSKGNHRGETLARYAPGKLGRRFECCRDASQLAGGGPVDCDARAADAHDRFVAAGAGEPTQPCAIWCRSTLHYLSRIRSRFAGLISRFHCRMGVNDESVSIRNLCAGIFVDCGQRSCPAKCRAN